jgi:8-oxo-dGTP diphosphatase
MSDKPFKLAVRAVIKDEQGRCLLIRRSNVCKHFVGQWEWPGGKVDEGETFDLAILREVREETGLEITLTGVVGVTEMEVEKVRVAVLCMEAKLTGGTFTLSEEHDMFKWVPIEEMLRLDLTEVLKELAESYIAAQVKGEENHG